MFESKEGRIQEKTNNSVPLIPIPVVSVSYVYSSHIVHQGTPGVLREPLAYFLISRDTETSVIHMCKLLLLKLCRPKYTLNKWNS